MDESHAERVVIGGGPRTGKTTLAGKFDCPVLHTDDLIETHTWESASDRLSHFLDQPGPWVMEGVAAVRALRKWLERNPEGVPCDRVVWCRTVRVPLTPAQETMMKGTEKIWREVRAVLRMRQVEIVYA